MFTPKPSGNVPTPASAARIARERRVIGQMMAIYCRHHHGTDGTLCPDCRALLDYSWQRMDHCPQGAAKTSCRKCPIHCYAPSKRAAVRAVMRYVGPRMLFHHPWAAIRHLIDEL